MNGLTTLGEGVRIAFEAIAGHKIRSTLTVLGVAVGVSVVVLVAALVTGIRTSVMAGFEAAGPDNFMVLRFDPDAIRLGGGGEEGRPAWWDWPPIEPEEAEMLSRLPAVEEALFQFDLGVDVDFEGRTLSGVPGQAYSSGWPKYSPGDFLAGRDFIPAEVRHARPVVVLSDALAEELFGRRDPIGRRVGISSPWRSVREEFTVVGVYEPAPNPFADAMDKWIVVPHTAAAKRLKFGDNGAVVLVVPRAGFAQRQALDQVTEALRIERRLGPRDANDFALLRSDQIIEIFDRLTGVFFLVMMALSSAGLMVGGVGVIGIMLISVTERTREIGIRKAVGATRREILWQFLVEAGMLTLLGGAVGMAGGAALAAAVERWTPVPAAIPLWSIIAALGMAIVTGMVFGLLPAYRASRLEPVAALRYE